MLKDLHMDDIRVEPVYLPNFLHGFDSPASIISAEETSTEREIAITVLWISQSTLRDAIAFLNSDDDDDVQ